MQPGCALARLRSSSRRPSVLSYYGSCRSTTGTCRRPRAHCKCRAAICTRRSSDTGWRAGEEGGAYRVVDKEKDRDWDREMREVDKLLAKLPDADPTLGRGVPTARSSQGGTPTVRTTPGVLGGTRTSVALDCSSTALGRGRSSLRVSGAHSLRGDIGRALRTCYLSWSLSGGSCSSWASCSRGSATPANKPSGSAPNPTNRNMTEQFRNFIAGEWVAPSTGEYFEN